MSKTRRQKERNSKQRNDRRNRKRNWDDQAEPMMSASNIHYDISTRTHAINAGGIGAIHLMVRKLGLIDAINNNLHLLKRHLPYHESDHVLNIAYNILAGGTRIEHLEMLRNDENYLNALGAQRIPDPTTAGDYCRRFKAEGQIDVLMSAINEIRTRVWKQQPEDFFVEAVIDADGTIAPTTGECKKGMDISHKGIWGYHPLLISLANTGEPLYLVNRGANRPSHEGANERLDQAITLCRNAGFKRILLRGDTDFSQTKYLDDWDNQSDVWFVFGMDAAKNLRLKADMLADSAWKRLVRRPKYEVHTEPRETPGNIKEQIVRDREYRNIRLNSEDVAEFNYSPGACKREYRMVVIRKNLTIERGERALFDDIRYFFYITNEWTRSAEEIVFQANKRCNQENLIEQMKNGVNAMRMPLDNLISNWAYMVMASLAWTLKAWFALLLPESGRWKEKHSAEKQTVLRMDFSTFLNAFMRIPCQIVRTGRRIVYKLLSWNPWQAILLRAVDQMRVPLRC